MRNNEEESLSGAGNWTYGDEKEWNLSIQWLIPPQILPEIASLFYRPFSHFLIFQKIVRHGTSLPLLLS
jgi:hypothetical protein